MANQTISSSHSKRLNILSSVITNEKVNKKIEAVFNDSKGDWKATMAKLKKENIDTPTLKRIDFAHSLADITGDNEKLVDAIATLPNINNMREFALLHNTNAISKLVTDDVIPKETPGATVAEKKKNYAVTIQSVLKQGNIGDEVMNLHSVLFFPVQNLMMKSKPAY